jgi:hypothetical protein
VEGGTVWRRYVRGSPLFTLAPTEEERAALRADLRSRVERSGIGALRSSPEVTRSFVLYASQFLARDAKRLEWEPVLTDLGVEERETDRYVELYDDVWRTLEGIGRTPIRHNGERRFLASLLREGGLPSFIGDIAALVVDRVTEIGWDAVQDEAARTWVVGRIQQSAGGAARRLLDTAEGRLALADFLSDAARARATLVEAGTDLSALATPDAVRKALEASGIDLPSVENEKLLLAVLGSFTTERASVAPRTEPLRLVAAVRQERVQLSLRVELDSLDLADVLPSALTHATLTAEWCQPPRRLLVRDDGIFMDASLRGRVVDFVLGGRRVATSVDVQYTGGGGVRQVVPLGTLEWPSDNGLWFDSGGELLLERREAIQPGEKFLVVLWDERSLRGTGAVEVREFAPPLGARRAYAVDVRGAGSVIVNNGGDETEIASLEHRLEVTVFNTPAPETIAATGFIRALPDVLVGDGIEVDVHARAFGEDDWRIVRRGARGRISLSADRTLRLLTGTVRIRLTSSDCRLWSASWCVLPRGFDVSSGAGRVIVRSAGTAVVRADRGTVDASAGDVVVTPPQDVDRIVLFLSMQTGERLRLPVTVTRGPLRLRADETSTCTLPLDGTTQLTERQVYSGACLELDDHPGANLTVSTRRGDVVLSMVQLSARRALLPLIELARYLQRTRESPMTFVARVDGSGDYAFRVHVPRLMRPAARMLDGGMEFEYSLDDLDVPEAPGIALFPVCPPTAAPAIVGCDFARSATGKYVARLRPERAPTVQGRYVAFLVDRRTEPERPMSPGRAISIPLELRELPCPAEVTGLDRALWTRAFDTAVAEINAKVGGPELVPFLRAFAATAQERSRYGLESFDLFTTVARRCPWVLLAVLPHLVPEDRDAWLGLWPQQIRNFTWLRFRRGDAALLAKALPRRSSEDRMALLGTAKAAHPMHRVVEYMLLDALFSGDSLRPIASARQYETNATRGQRSWEPFQLPQTVAGRRWLIGADLDPDILASVAGALERQILFGARARAVRALFMRHEVPQHAARFVAPSSTLAARVLPSLEADWRTLATTQLAHQIKGLDREMAIASMLVAEYASGLRDLDDGAFAHILELEQCSPQLLDYWLLAADLLRKDGP